MRRMYKQLFQYLSLSTKDHNLVIVTIYTDKHKTKHHLCLTEA